MKNIVILIAITIFFSLSCTTEKSKSEKIDVHIILGQSNAIGRALKDSLPDSLTGKIEGAYIFDAFSNERHFVYNLFDFTGWETMEAGKNTQSRNDQFGPVLMASKLLKEYKGKETWFIVFGEGGTALSTQEGKKDWNPESEELTQAAKEVIERARCALIDLNKEPTFKSITWWQGEKDAEMSVSPDDYLNHETAFFNELKSVSYLSDSRRVIFKLFSDSGPTSLEINRAKEERAEADPLTIKIIEVEEYSRRGKDRLHAGAEGQIQAGKDLFEAIRDL